MSDEETIYSRVRGERSVPIGSIWRTADTWFAVSVHDGEFEQRNTRFQAERCVRAAHDAYLKEREAQTGADGPTGRLDG